MNDAIGIMLELEAAQINRQIQIREDDEMNIQSEARVMPSSIEIGLSSKEMMLSAQLSGNPDTQTSFGARKMPEGFALMRVDQKRPDKFYYVKWDGDYSGLGTHNEVWAWIKANVKANDE